MRLHSLSLTACFLAGCSSCRSPGMADVGLDARAEIASLDGASPSDQSMLRWDLYSAPEDVVDVPFDQYIWNGDSRCYPMPDVLPVPGRDAACGDGCLPITWTAAGAHHSIVEEGDTLVFANNAAIMRRLNSGLVLNSIPFSTLSADSPCSDGTETILLTGFSVDPEGVMRFSCLRESPFFEWQLYQTTRDRRQACLVYEEAIDSDRTENAQSALQRLRSATAFLQGRTTIPPDVFVLSDGALRPRQLTTCRCVLKMGGGDDTLVWVQEDLRNGQNGSLWMSRYPFETTRQIWAPNRALLALETDPTNPHRFTVTAGDGDPVCAYNADVYYFDTETIDRIPPRLLTQAGTSQLYGVLRGDRVAWLDLSEDTFDPAGCPDGSHNVYRLVLSSLSSGQTRVVHRDVFPMSPRFLGEQRLYVQHAHGFGYLPLP